MGGVAWKAFQNDSLDVLLAVPLLRTFFHDLLAGDVEIPRRASLEKLLRQGHNGPWGISRLVLQRTLQPHADVNTLLCRSPSAINCAPASLQQSFCKPPAKLLFALKEQFRPCDLAKGMNRLAPPKK